jgi:hypothetical protein
MLQGKRLSPLPQSLHAALVDALGSLADTTPVAPPAEVLAIAGNPFSLNIVSPSAATTATTSVPPQLTAPVATPAATIRQLQRADAPPLDVFAADPFRCVRDASLASSSAPAEGLAASVNFVRGVPDRECCAYYKLAFDLPAQPGASAGGQPGMCLIEISPEYPVRPPQILLTSRTTVLNAGVQAQNVAQIDNAKKALECEVNAGCLSLISPDLPALSSHLPAFQSAGAIVAAEEALDATLTFQLGLLLSLAAVNNNASMSSAVTATGSVLQAQADLPSRKRGRNRRAGAIEGLYGRFFPF